MKRYLYWLSFATALFGTINPLFAAECPEDSIERQYNERAGSVAAVSSPMPLEGALIPVVYEVAFSQTEFFATNFRCSVTRQQAYPAYRAFTWLIELPNDEEYSVLPIRNLTNAALESEGSNIQRIGDIVLFLESGRELFLSSSIDFLVNNNELLFPDSSQFRLLVSGPFFRPTKDGEEPIGIILSKTLGKLGEYRNFSGRHVLCVGQNGLDLLERDWLAEKLGVPTSNEKVLDSAIDKYATENCSDAFQTGPAFWERPRSGDTQSVPGISGLSLRAAQRNVIFRIGSGEDYRTFLASSISSVSSFDMMVIVAAIAAEIDDTLPVVWAIGLQDEDYLAGPLLQLDGNQMRLAPTHRPTGAVLVLK
ncbi:MULTISPECIES: hypothetical protein [unclassified Ruegeria]|uniref:hypothetical protein n=1 Tax=unclassified Ruegeria TaxID=2625375 RepID=UPI0014890FD6|nr:MULTISPECIES: hypothetical protein [unclassified Ruegeria]NOE33483.1 hypothetical protein [Ruegeria sp. HKCCD7318]